jgi:hypothetical protein
VSPNLAKQPIEVRARDLAALEIGGAIQVQAAYHNFAAESDSDKLLSATLRSLKLEMDGQLNESIGFLAQLLFAPAENGVKVNDAYLYWQGRNFSRFQAGVQSKTFSHESMTPDELQPLIGSGRLYQGFLETTTGYAGKDLGFVLQGGFEDDAATLYYQIGAFNGKQNDDPKLGYGDAQATAWDDGFFAKDFTARVLLHYSFGIEVEGALSTKGGENRSNPSNFSYSANKAYQLGARLAHQKFRLEGELAAGDNHQGRDALILEGSSQFFAFFAQTGWVEKYSQGRSSELWVKLEGLDPTMSYTRGKGVKNDGLFRYSVGLSYGFTEKSALMANYGVLQPITGVVGEDGLSHDFDLLWRLSF